MYYVAVDILKKQGDIGRPYFTTALSCITLVKYFGLKKTSFQLLADCGPQQHPGLECVPAHNGFQGWETGAQVGFCSACGELGSGELCSPKLRLRIVVIFCVSFLKI